jgi:hypothetical protein
VEVDSSVIRTADHELYPWYPDLLFFHVYGPMRRLYGACASALRLKSSFGRAISTVSHATNQPHTLTLIPKGGALGIGEFVVHAPAASSNAIRRYLE